MRSQPSCGVALAAYFGACLGFLLFVTSLSRCGLSGGPAELERLERKTAEMRATISRDVQRAKDQERRALEDISLTPAQRAQRDALEEEFWNQLRLQIAGESSLEPKRTGRSPRDGSLPATPGDWHARTPGDD
jgi:hypothetical protein